ncbi:MAG: hypothetical protein ACXW3Z_05390 [Limisphaerales bacterium]
MKPQHLRENLAAAQSRELTIKMSDGSVLHVPHTDFIAVNASGDQVVLFADGRKLRILDTHHITNIEFETAKAKR